MWRSIVTIVAIWIGNGISALDKSSAMDSDISIDKTNDTGASESDVSSLGTVLIYFNYFTKPWRS